MPYIFLLLLLTLNACSVQVTDTEAIPNRPLTGYNRNTLFPRYTIFNGVHQKTPLSDMLFARTDWLSMSSKFRETYPKFNISLLSFNQFAEPNYFSWEERIMFADAMDILVLAINSPQFDQEMAKYNFFNNERTQQIKSEVVVQQIRDAAFSIVLGKRTLTANVLAEATVGGLVNYVWFRNDVDYTMYNVSFLAMILGHELTHNLGYRHSSNVPYGVHNPILNSLAAISDVEANVFKSVTPYHEQAYLEKVRLSTSSYERFDNIEIEQDFHEDWHKHL